MTSPETAARILVVEDEHIIAADLEGTLRDLGHNVVAAVGDPAAALRVADREKPDLVLMDICLHGSFSGIDAADTIRRTLDIPTVFLTAYTGAETLQQARAAGAFGFLSKPFRTKDLNAAILIALQQHRLGRELFAEQNWFSTMLASVSDGVIATDSQGVVRYLNPAAALLTNWKPADAIGHPIEDVYPLHHLDGTTVKESQLRRALQARAPIPKSRFLMHVKEDHVIPIEDAAAPIIEEGHLLGAVTIFLDISAQLHLESRQQEEQGRLQQQVHSASAALGRTREELRALSGRLLTAQEDERSRLARELHDDLGQRTALMGWRVAQLSQSPGGLSPQALSELHQLQLELDQLAAGLRSVSHQLHPAVIADLGLADALRQLAAQQQALGQEIALILHDIPPGIPFPIATCLYRVAQEALRNAAQHAPGAPVRVTLAHLEQHLELNIQDAGPGFDLAAVRRSGGGLGLLSMSERTRLLGGSLQIRTDAEGTGIVARVPLAKPAAGSPPEPSRP